MAYKYSSRAAETRELSDWPPLRPTGPEPGSYDSPPQRGPLGAINLSGSERQMATIALAAGAAWYFLIRKPKRGKRR